MKKLFKVILCMRYNLNVGDKIVFTTYILSDSFEDIPRIINEKFKTIDDYKDYNVEINNIELLAKQKNEVVFI